MSNKMPVPIANYLSQQQWMEGILVQSGKKDLKSSALYPRVQFLNVFREMSVPIIHAMLARRGYPDSTALDLRLYDHPGFAIIRHRLIRINHS